MKTSEILKKNETRNRNWTVSVDFVWAGRGGATLIYLALTKQNKPRCNIFIDAFIIIIIIIIIYFYYYQNKTE